MVDTRSKSAGTPTFLLEKEKGHLAVAFSFGEGVNYLVRCSDERHQSSPVKLIN
jgi:hypothetical protein